MGLESDGLVFVISLSFLPIPTSQKFGLRGGDDLIKLLSTYLALVS